MTTTRLPSGRAGALDGLPSGKRVAAIWLSDAPDGTPIELLDGYPVGCIHHDSRHCSAGSRVLIYEICDLTDTADTPIVCPAHAASRYGVMPTGEPTPSYIAAVTDAEQPA